MTHLTITQILYHNALLLAAWIYLLAMLTLMVSIIGCSYQNAYLVNSPAVSQYTTLPKGTAEPTWYLPGDVAIFRDSSGTFCHTVIAVTGDATHFSTNAGHQQPNGIYTIAQYFSANPTWTQCTYYHLVDQTQPASTHFAAGDTLTVTASSVKMRNGPSYGAANVAGSESTAILSSGNVVQVLSDSQNGKAYNGHHWWKMQFGTYQGWCAGDDTAGNWWFTKSAPTPVLNISTPAAIAEGDTGTQWLWFTVTLSSASSQTVTVNYATSNGTATAGSDYTATSNTLTFSPGQTSEQVYVPILGDYVIEGDETFTMTLSGAWNATIGTATATATILNDDVAGTITLSSSTYSVNENAGTVTVTVNRSGGLASGVGVNYATSNGTATAGSDFISTSGTLTFGGGETSKTFTVTILDDAVYEGSETFNVALSGQTGGATLGSPSSATVTILDNETPPPGSVQFSSSTYSVNENGGTVTITATRTGGSYGSASVNYATANGTATAGSDYTTKSGTLNWADGDAASKTFTVTIIDDAVYEGSETFAVNLSGATGVSLGSPATATVTIVDNEAPDTTPDPFTFTAQTGAALNATATSNTITVSGINAAASISITGGTYSVNGGSYTSSAGR